MVFFLLVVSLFSFGCAGHRPTSYLSPNFYAKASPKVAVLPFDNQSVDLLAPEELQGLVRTVLAHRGYAPAPAEAVQQKLKDIGITDGGQLPSVSAQKLGDALQVDGLFYGTIEDFVFQNVGYIVRRAVKLRLKFVLASTGETLWEDEKEAQNIIVATKNKEAVRNFAWGMAEKAVGNMAKRPLWMECQQVVQKLMVMLPNPGIGSSGPNPAATPQPPASSPTAAPLPPSAPAGQPPAFLP